MTIKTREKPEKNETNDDQRADTVGFVYETNEEVRGGGGAAVIPKGYTSSHVFPRVPS